jgi:hypothetical protein
MGKVTVNKREFAQKTGLGDTRHTRRAGCLQIHLQASLKMGFSKTPLHLLRESLRESGARTGQLFTVLE